MTIHHSTRKKAETLGVIMTELESDGGEFAIVPAFPNTVPPAGTVQAFWPKFNVYAFGAGEKPATAALNEMESLIKIKAYLADSVIINDSDDPFLVRVYADSSRDRMVDHEPLTPTDALRLVEDDKHVWVPTTIPKHGGEAHRAGFPITDNPYDEEDDAEDFARWDEEWEESADEADAEDNGEDSSGSVVKSAYRIRYAEAGHPNHCGDWLAVYCVGLDIEQFEELCEANDVDLSKYNRTNVGWQGRLKMTGRNLLARKIYLNGGNLSIPKSLQVDGVDVLRAPADWMNTAATKYRAPKKAA